MKSIAWRVGLGFAGVTLVTLVVGGVGVYGARNLGALIGESNQVLDLIDHSQNASSAFHAYQLDKTSDNAAAVQSAVGQIDSGLERLSGVLDTGTLSQNTTELLRQIAAVGAANAAHDAALKTIDETSRKLAAAATMIVKGAHVKFTLADGEADAALDTISDAGDVLEKAEDYLTAVLKAQTALARFAFTRDGNDFTTGRDALDGAGRVLADLKKFDNGSIQDSVDNAKVGLDEIVSALNDFDQTRIAGGDTGADATGGDAAVSDDFSGIFRKLGHAADFAEGLKDKFIRARGDAFAALRAANASRKTTLSNFDRGQAFGDAVNQLNLMTGEYRVTPTRENRDAAEKVLNVVEVLGQTLKVLNLPDVAEPVAAYKQAFADLVKANADNEAASSQATSVERSTSDAISTGAAGVLASARTLADRIGLLSMAALALGLLLSGGIALVIGRALSRPITALTASMRRLADGDTTASPPGLDRADEIGAMARTVQVFRDNAVERARLEAVHVTDEATRQERQRAIERLIDGFRGESATMLGTVSGHAERMQSTAGHLASIANQSLERANEATEATTAAAANVSSVASSAEELSSSIHEIASQVSKSVTVVGEATEKAAASNAQVVGLTEAATRIGNVINMISSIAEQTNLLALNATIEAARAGEAGKGFAVVAAEVKQLADETGKATQEIATQVEGIQLSTGDAAGAIEGIGKAMTEVDSYTNTIAAAIEEQGSATSEISRNAQNAATGTAQITRTMSELVGVANETASVAQNVAEVAKAMTEANADLTRIVDRFLDGVAAA